MAKYSDIKGFTVQTVSTDPAASAAASGSWASGGNMNTTHAYAGGAGIQTAALVFAGVTPAQTANTEQYDGSSWTEVGDMNQAAGYLESAGVVYTAALAIGGHRPDTPTAFNEIWDGSSWTEGADLNTARSFAGSSGSSTSALIYGGIDPSYPPHTGKTESWNGSSWTEVSDINTVREINAGIGVNNSNAISAGGTPGPTTVESWDGSSWTEVSEINTGRYAAAGFGVYNDGIICGGHTGSAPTTATESWDGSSWTEVADLSQTRTALKSGYGCPSSAGIAFGGIAPPGSTYKNNTEEWTTLFTPTTLKKITQGQLFFNSTTNTFKETVLDIPATSWSSGGSLNTARGFSSGAGTQTAALCISGGPGNRANVEQYNGSSWTETTDVNADRLEAGAFGGYTSANYVGGYDPGPANRIASNESWNGSSWTEVNDLPTATDNLMQGAGTQTAGMIVGGVIPTPVKTTNNIFYDGTNWTASGSLNSGRALGAVSGSQTSALVSTGLTGPPSSPSPTTNTANVETWDGSSWTEVSNVNTQRYRVVGSGDAGSGLIFAGTNYPSTAMSAKTESWNGTSWSEINDLSTAREAGSTTSGTGSTAASTLLAGGTTPSVQSATEEWTSDLANKTITAS